MAAEVPYQNYLMLLSRKVLVALRLLIAAEVPYQNYRYQPLF